MDDAAAGSARMNIGRLLDDGPWTVYGKLVLMFAALAFTVDGLAGQVLGLSMPALIKAWHIPRAAFASVNALGLLGVAIGTTTGGVLGDRFGRRWVLNASIILFGAVTAATAWINAIGDLALLRTVAGLGLGAAIPNATALIAEFTPIAKRSLAIAIGMTFIPVGGLICSTVAALALASMGWRSLFLITGGASIAAGLLLIMVMPESPRLLLRKAGPAPGLIRLLSRLGYRVPDGAILVDESHTLSRTPLNALFGRAVRRDTLSLWSAFFFCLLAAYSFFTWAPVMLASRGFDLSATSAGLTGFNLGGIFGGILVGWIIGRFGSRAAMLATVAVGLTVSVVLAVSPFSPGHGLVGVIVGMALEGAAVSGLQMGAYTISAHVYPAFVRATGVGAASASGRIGAVVSSFTAVLTLNAGGARGYFAFIAAAMGAAIVSLLFVRGQMGASSKTPKSSSTQGDHRRAAKVRTMKVA